MKLIKFGRWIFDKRKSLITQSQFMTCEKMQVIHNFFLCFIYCFIKFCLHSILIYKCIWYMSTCFTLSKLYKIFLASLNDLWICIVWFWFMILYCKSLTWCSILIHETFHIYNTSKQKKGENTANLLKIVSSVYNEHGSVYLYN